MEITLLWVSRKLILYSVENHGLRAIYLSGLGFRLMFCRMAKIAVYDISKRFRSYWLPSEIYVVMLLKETGSNFSCMEDPCPFLWLERKSYSSNVRHWKIVWERCKDWSENGRSMTVKSRGVQVPWSHKYVPSRAIRITCYNYFRLCSLSFFNLFLVPWEAVLLEPSKGHCSLFSPS